MEDKKKFIINVLFYSLILALIYIGIYYFLPLFMPFIISFLIAVLALYLVKKVFKKDKTWIRLLATTLVFVLLFALIVFLAVISFNKTVSIVETTPTIYREYVEPTLDSLEQAFINMNRYLPSAIKTDVNDLISNVTSSLKNSLSSFSSSIVSFGTSLISNTTSVIVDVIIIIVCTYFFVLDYEMITTYLIGLLTDNGKDIYYEIKAFLVNNVFSVIKCYGLIMLVTFIELLLGFLVLKIDNNVLLALLICILDILPVLGVGTVLIPWGIIALILGDYYIGVGILLLYLIITVIRNIIEPKLVGANLGLHPLATLVSMIVGLKIFGIIGLFGLPLTLSFFIKRKKVA